MYGRATTLYPHTLEMLDQLDLLEELNQIGYIGRTSVTYKDGKRVTSRGWHVMFERMNGTFLDYCLNIQQKYSEEVIQGAYKQLGGVPYVEWKLEEYAVDQDSASGIINKAPSSGMISAGWRGPDALVYAPGSRLPTRLFHRTKNCGQWSIIVFAGQPIVTHNVLAPAVERLQEIAKTLPANMNRFLTLVAQSAAEGDLMFKLPKIGNVYYDQDRAAHSAYSSISTMNGAVVVLRPDGILGHAAPLSDLDGVASFPKGFTQIDA
ncbi:pentachlorophenol 4-monooxygenase [Aspergillus affinis]|uniref:pentachlorophenol 4-monooxygenase n=1 Tax=Aspergillus affinis TaxID=1070780 RepID=UPI0022FDF64A|nr:pentachlorophenol 4-monooxygenase [Aspergillus affinis]KAI9036905.1 pentachlorophenol 4-monooxygenase [Aspergillus affinis]